MSATRKLHIKSYGCQMNVYDSQRMTDMMAQAGFAETSSPEDADLIVLNTCHIREKAAEKVYSELGRMRKLKESAAEGGRKLVVAVAGCVAQAEGEEIIRRAPSVDLVLGPQVQEGCDKFCTFCVVPYTRGSEVSRPPAKIVGEVERLVDAGVREVTLIGQNVNAYHGEGDGGPWSLARLLHRLAGIPRLARLRYATSHPRDMNTDMGADLIASHRDLAALMPQLHLPVQSGSDRILAVMNRRHTRADYLDVIARLRDARPDMAFTSDFIVGYPGETEEDFRATLSIVTEVGYAGAFSFKYSPRPGTPAAERDDQVDEGVKVERLARLQAEIDRHQDAFNARCVGRTFEVLFEKPGRLPGQLVGRSPYLQPVHVMAPPSLIGEVAAVAVNAMAANSLFGTRERPAPGRIAVPEPASLET